MILKKNNITEEVVTLVGLIIIASGKKIQFQNEVFISY